ncbi:response regulator transcription factor [Cytophagaceae bacterium DM2B3-1]|uniref:Response regulator transcription factor n=1 Tax=Xanthocytophaga flava TaxID=3048013 RepID=A0ABT7CZ33_9BACT|nr:response regulator transcription factor [Xanthocytophaga flavus]MDJ1498215.1 response regulator transcription factor [Xanthocytophaga flavus]
MINVGIADDHSLFREGIRMIIDSMEGIQLTLEAESGKDLLSQLKEITVDVILLDIEMKDISGIETLKTLSIQHSKPKIIVLSMHTEPRMISYMMEQDANGYLPKDVKRDELELAIRTVYEKGMYLNEMVSKSLLAGLKNRSKKSLPSMELSPREKEILELICQEYTMQEIGEKLFISERTVEGHRKNICIKLDVKNTAGLVRKAVLLNLIDISPI